MDAEDLELIEPTESLREQYLEYCRQFAGVGQIHGNASMATCADFHEAVQAARDHARGRNLPAGWVPAHTLWLVRAGRTLVGMINLRHALTPYLSAEGGHIGYSVRPTERGKGYATRMLAMTLEKARTLGLERVLLTCDKHNAASARVIRKCGGVLEDEVPSVQAGGAVTKRYWIDLQQQSHEQAAE
jgi:predicted acetyltransferase